MRQSTSHWSFTFTRKLLGTPLVIFTSTVRHTKRFLAGPPVVAVDASQPRARVTEVEIDGVFRSITAEPVRFVQKGKKYVESVYGSLVAVAKGKQFRYVPLAA